MSNSSVRFQPDEDVNKYQSAKPETSITDDKFQLHRVLEQRDQVQASSEHVKDDSIKQPSQKRSVLAKPATYDGTLSWKEYRAHFEACAEINYWSYELKGLYLAVSHRGQAQCIFSKLSTKTNEYDKLSSALEERFLPPNQSDSDLYRVQLRERKQKPKENLSELAQDIRRLTNLAYPIAPANVRETLAKEQFVDSLYCSEIRIRT